MLDMRSSRQVLIVLIVALCGLSFAPGGVTSYTIKEAKLCHLRLPTNVIPVEYDIDLKFQNGFSVITGKVDISIEIQRSEPQPDSSVVAKFLANLCKPARNKIVLHLDGNLRILEAKLSMSKSRGFLNSGERIEAKIKRIVRDNRSGTISIELERDLSSDLSLATLSIAYESQLPNPGLVKPGHWSDAGNIRPSTPSHYVAQFQGGRARTLFPCFDEPQFRSKLRLKVQHLSARPLSIVTNLIKREHHYESSHPMPVSGLVLGFREDHSARRIESIKLDGGPRVSMTSLRDDLSHSPEGSFALDFASRCIKWLETNTEVDLPFERFELVGVPGSEQWGPVVGSGLGLIDYKLLSVGEDRDEQDEARRVEQYELRAESALNVALAAARQWFGYVLRPDGWSNLWITEGLAARAALKMADQLEPDLQLHHYVRSHYLKRALRLDVDGQFPPISHPGDYPTDATTSPGPFNMLRFVKAAAIMQMLERIVAPGIDFDKVVGSLVKSGSRSSEGISLEKLVAALVSNGMQQPDQIKKLLRPWVELSGFPAMRISLDENFEAITVQHLKSSTRLNSEGERVVKAPSQWPLQLKFLFYSKTNLQFNEVDLLGKLLDAKRSMAPSETRVSLGLPDWLQRVRAEIQLQDDYQVLPYYEVDCSSGPITCP